MRAVVFCVLSCLVVSTVAITLTSSEFDVRRVIPNNFMQALTFTPNGDLYITDGLTYCKYPNAANLPIGGTLSDANRTCGSSNVNAGNWASSKTGRLYTVFGHEIDTDTWQGVRRWTNCGATHGIAVDPRDGAIFVASNNGVTQGKVWRIPNPDTYTGVYATNCTGDLYFDLGAAGYQGFDAITIGPDGTFYGAGWSAGRFVVVSAWTAATPKGTLIAAKSTVNRAPDGVSICVGNGNSFALIAATSGSISKFNLTGPGGAPDYAESTIATNIGGYLDFTAVDTKGCIWGSTMTLTPGALGVYRVTNADGTCGCSSAIVPPPEPTPSACPNCSEKKTAQYPGEVNFSESFQSSSNCASLSF